MNDMPIWLSILIAVLSAVVFGALGVFLGIQHRKKQAESTIGSAEQEAKRIVSDAIKTSEAKKKDAILEGREEIHRLRNEADREIADRRREVQRQERRLQQKEENLDRKLESAEQKEEAIAKKNRKADERLNEAEQLKQKQFEELERISGFTLDQAKEYLLKNLQDELTHEKAVKIREMEQQTREESEKNAREIISLAIQRCAADHVAEAAISVVPLPNDEMKGRIIGR